MPAIGATLLAPLLIYWICRTSALALGGATALAAGSSLPPAEYSAVLKGLVRASATPGFRATPEVVGLARAGLVAAPLAFEPFFIAAKAEEQAGRMDRALLLMQEMRRRRPNHLPTRAQLAVYHGQKGNYAAFIEELDYLLNRGETAQRPLLPEMAKVIALPEGRRALAQMLAREPSWREEFFKVAADQKVDPGHAAALLSLIRGLKKSGNMDLEQQFYMRTLVSAGQYQRAKAVWSASYGGSQGAGNLVFDGDFQGRKAPPPFNWTLQDTELGRATFAAAGEGRAGLDVDYFGGRDAVIAEQSLALPPGRYQLSFVSRGERAATSGRVFWRVGCLPADRELARSELRPASADNSPYTASFMVPSGGCPGQRLQLIGEPGEVATPATFKVSNLSIRKNG